MLVVYVCGIYCLHELYCYTFPHYWLRGYTKNGQEARYRMRDILSSAVAEELFGNQYSELIYSPHSFHYKRKTGLRGYHHADDPRVFFIFLTF